MMLMHTRRTPLRIAWATALLALLAVNARGDHIESTVQGPREAILFCDLDGDRLKDIVLIDEPNLLVFYQDAGKGFAGKADQVCSLEDRPSVVWPARLGANTESLLVMTSDGVTELDLSRRRGPTARRQIIAQRTILPEKSDDPSVAYFPLSPRTQGSVRVILVPVGSDLQIWRRDDVWGQVQTLKDALETSVWASQHDLGYDRASELTLSLGDINGDQREDIILRTSFLPMCRDALYAQGEDGRFFPNPFFTRSGPQDWSWRCWTDIDRDGRVDLIKSTGLQTPWFFPGTYSGKVLVQVYFADAQNRLPAQPQQVFRKNDWIDSVPTVDIDGDGCMDLVLGYSAFDSREGFRKVFTAKQLDFKLRFHFCRPGRGFPEKADCDVDLLIRLDRPSIDLTYPRAQNFETFVNLQGDFDGDGDKDLLVRDRADLVSVYHFVSRQAGFVRDANAGFRYADPIDRFLVEDLNDDRISDLVMRLSDKGMWRVFVSRTRE